MATARKRAAARSRAKASTSRREALWIESSALLRVLLEGDAALAAAFRSFSRFATSSLTLIEVPRALARARREGRLSTAQHSLVQRRYRSFVGNCAVAEITVDVRERAATEFPVEPIRSLDAIHLAALLVSVDVLGPVVLASCDRRMRENANALGFDVLPQDAI